ncbi:hypothetical protein [Amphritea sp.]|uniref:hypothetical protein n=1 Tax=Amphritea sp. TaxID=1872502 RepID=UPI003A92ECA6
MIREYALNPDVVVSDISILQRFFSEFGAEKGRLIIDVPEKWTLFLYRKIQKLNMKPVEKKGCLLGLEKIKKYGISPKSSFSVTEGDAWLSKVFESPAADDLHAILDEESVDDPKVFCYSNMLGEFPDDWELGQTESVERSADKMTEAVSISLRLAKALYLVDPYFDPRADRYRVPLLRFIEEIGKGRIGLKKLVIHTIEQSQDPVAPKNRAEIERGLNQHVQPCLPAGFQVDVWIRPLGSMHDRFLLTNMVGYSFGHGLNEDTSDPNSRVSINRLSASGRDEQWKFFANPEGRLGDVLSVVGT